MNRDEKQDQVATLNEIFNTTQVGLLVDYRGLDVAEISDLRRKLHETATQMRILKNRLAKLAIRETPFAGLEDLLTEPRALIFSDEPVGPAKALSQFMKGNPKIEYISGILVTPSGISVLDGAAMRTLGNLPSREELLMKLLFVMKGTQSQFVRTLHEIPGKFVRTLAALAAAKGES